MTSELDFDLMHNNQPAVRRSLHRCSKDLRNLGEKSRNFRESSRQRVEGF